MMRRLIRRLRGDMRGATIIEFALVVPVMLLMLMGFMELAFQAYVQSVLSGAIRKAGRDAGIQGGQLNWSAIDQAVLTQVNKVDSKAVIYLSTHQSYSSFSTVAVPEPYTDSNGNGKYDAASECFTDINGNGTWDADQGTSNSQGGASDVEVYTLQIRYPRLFPLGSKVGWSSTATLTGRTIMKNQPYTAQAATSPKTCCPNAGCA